MKAAKYVNSCNGRFVLRSKNILLLCVYVHVRTGHALVHWFDAVNTENIWMWTCEMFNVHKAN
jgi:hypothetical protein